MTETLAPAGTPEAFYAAVRAGADAIYFGVGNFNARRNAKNFTEEDMSAAVRYAKQRDVKTYLTLNTLTADSELSAVLKAAFSAAAVGVDALIVQDMGLIKVLREYLPDMPLHASTQMSVHSKEALKVLKEMGFSRVVVAREVDRKALKEICLEAKRLGLEVEAFVHGALCMCLSGQCYLSSILGGRSGNRGLCAQPCRLSFSAKGSNGYDLSLKDMSYISHISEMADMGVTSFKIEGRMKRPEYVAAAVFACRCAADRKPVPKEITRLLSGIFSRSGHTDGYFVNNLGRDMFGVRTEQDERLSGTLLNSAHELYRRERQSVAIKGRLHVVENSPVVLTVWDNSGNSVTVEGELPEAAKTRPLDCNTAKAKIEKCGGTQYYFEDVECDIGQDLAVGGAVLSALRQSALTELDALRGAIDDKRVKNNKVAEFAPTSQKRTSAKPMVVASFFNIEQIPNKLYGVDAVILPVETDFSKVHLPENIKVIADIPRGVLHKADKVTELLKKAKENGVKAAVCGNLAAYTFCQAAGLLPIAGFGMNVYNSKSVEAVAELGSKAVVLSFEMSLVDAVRTCADIQKGIITYGRLPLMLFRNCPGKNGDGCKACKGHTLLTDRKGVEFPVMCRGEFSEMFNSRPIWMFDRAEELIGLDFQILMFTDETKDRCEEVLLAAEYNRQPDVEFTRGLYYRDVL